MVLEATVVWCVLYRRREKKKERSEERERAKISLPRNNRKTAVLVYTQNGRWEERL
jgi:hypothetical protein